MNKTYTIYKHTTPNGKVYIGITSTVVERRWANGKGYKTQKFFYRAINKYGWENIKHEILLYGIDEETAKSKEREYIALYESNNPSKGYNRTLGGDGTLGYTLSEETKRKISKANKGKVVSEVTKHRQSESMKKFYKNNPQNKIRLSELNRGRKLSEETKNKLSESHKGKKNYWYGKKIPIQMRKKMSITHTGKKMSQEAIEKMRKANMGKVLSDEHKLKISKANKGTNHWNYGKKASEETKRKQSESHKGQIPWNKGKKIANRLGEKHHNFKRIICTTTGDTFSCQREAGEFYKIKSYSNINSCCRGIRNFCGKLTDGTKLEWMYYEDYIKLNSK